MSNSQNLPNGYILKLRKHCGLGTKGKLISTHKTENEAVTKAKSLGHSLGVFEILDLYGDRTLTARM